MLLRKFSRLQLGRRVVRLWRWRRSMKYHRLEPERPPAGRILRWAFSLKQRFFTPVPGCGRDKKPSPPPKGHMVVYVGGGEKEVGPPQRCLVPVIYCNHPLFGELLREAEEEFGFNHPGGITISCTVSRFERVRNRIAAGYAVSCRKSGCRTMASFS